MLAPEDRILRRQVPQARLKRLAQTGWERIEEAASQQLIGLKPAEPRMGSIAERDAQIAVDPADHLRLVLDDGPEPALTLLEGLPGRSAVPQPSQNSRVDLTAIVED